MEELMFSLKNQKNILKNLGFDVENFRGLSDILGLKYEFEFEHGIMADIIESAFITHLSQKDIRRVLEINIHQSQNPNFLCIRCIPGDCMDGGPKFELISSLGRNIKAYSGKIKIISKPPD